jgi:RNA polymerase sigma factor (sigma-70 family)
MELKAYNASYGLPIPNFPQSVNRHQHYSSRVPGDLRLMGQNGQDFTIIFEVFYKQLCCFSFKLVKDWESAEDIVADIFMNLWEKPREFATSGSLKRWLYKCLFNRSINHNKRRNIQASDDSNSVDIYNKLTQIVEKETLIEIFFLINQLPPKCKSIIELYYFAGWQYDQIAEQFKISIHTVKNQRLRGIMLVRNGLSRS